jgi:hypothetical protein
MADVSILGCSAAVLASRDIQQSRVSSRFVHAHAPQKSRLSSLSAPVSASARATPLTCFTCVIDFVVDPQLLHCDAILGLDWASSCQRVDMSEVFELTERALDCSRQCFHVVSHDSSNSSGRLSTSGPSCSSGVLCRYESFFSIFASRF